MMHLGRDLPPGRPGMGRGLVGHVQHRLRQPTALVEMLLFMATVFVAYAYVWRRGGLNWD